MITLTDIRSSPLFSIIVPTYNRAHTIQKAIDSVIYQTYTNWELIIVDDGSTDETRKLVGDYSDKRIRYVWQENEERSAARNHGIRLALGDWICFLDSDDAYLPEHLKVLHEAMVTHADYHVFRTAYVIHNDNEVIYCNHFPHGRYDNSPFDSFTSFAFSKYVIKEFLFDERFFMGEDFHFLLRLGHKYPFFIIEKHTVSVFYSLQNSGGIGPNYNINIKAGIHCYDDILQWYKGPVLPFIKRKRCLFVLLLLKGSVQYNKKEIFKSLMTNVKSLFRFPVEYIRLVIRISYVIFGEKTGWYSPRYRF